MDKYKLFLLAVFIIAWTSAALSPTYRASWLLENLYIFALVPVIFLVGYYFKLSNFSYTLITIFMLLHIAGAHYTYAEVPFGFVLQDWFNASRNIYDRLVHFSFGFLLAYPLREVFMRLSQTKGFWAYYFPFDLTLALSAVYEITEWALVRVADPAAGLAFLGVQGDVWDAQKDMLMAAIGATVAMAITFLVNWYFYRDSMAEVKASFRIQQGENTPGEEKLRQYLKDKTKKKKLNI